MHYLPSLLQMKYFLRTKSPDLRGTSGNVWNNRSIYIQEHCLFSYTFSEWHVLASSSQAWVFSWGDQRGGGFAVSVAEKKHKKGLLLYLLSYAPFWALQDNRFYIFYHSWMYYLYPQVMKSIFTVNDKETYCFMKSLTYCDSTCKVAGNGESDRLFWSSAHQKTVCVYLYTWNELVHMYH